uniref:Calmodulin-lysine N-methyltransferase n=1 Tax=Alexandrium monilatum TaxID=311494 RepID=A0A7S4QJW1_9DINO
MAECCAAPCEAPPGHGAHAAQAPAEEQEGPDEDILLNIFTDYKEVAVEYEAVDGTPIRQSVLGWSQGACQTVWSEALPRTIAFNLACLSGRRVLELGAGCGLLGLVAAHSAAEVVLTDGDEEEAALLRVNAAQHGPPGGARVSGAHLDWGLEPAEAAAEAMGGRGSFDVILGSQICHNPKYIRECVETISFFLAPDGEAFIFNDRASLMSSREVCRGILDASIRELGLQAQDALLPDGPLVPPAGVREELALREGAYLLRITRA